jgi:uncharacterized coiled-coil protein SlyX
VKGENKMNELENKIKFFYDEISNAESVIADQKAIIKECKGKIRTLEKIQTKLSDLYV